MEFLVLAGIIKVVVDRIKDQFGFSGSVTNLVAVAVGVAVAFAGQLDYAAEVFNAQFDAWLAYAVTGVGLGAGASVIHEAIE